MFTGIIQATGELVSFVREGQAGGRARIVVRTPWTLEDVVIGESIAVNGCCLTVVHKDQHMFAADLSDETLRLTALGSLQVGDALNLERALRMSDRLGGHIVTGHIDGIGRLESRQVLEGAVALTVSLPQPLTRYLVDKGSVTLDGVSLTLSCDLLLKRAAQFRVYIIPHTGEETTLLKKQVGDMFNIEVDYLAKLVEGLLPQSEPVQ